MPVKIGPVIKVEGEREYRQSMRGIISESKQLQSEMDLLSSQFSKEGKSLEQNRKQRDLLNKQIQNTEKALKEQQQRLMEVATATNENGERTDELRNKTNEFQSVVNKTEAELNQLKATLKELPSDMEMTGQSMQKAGDALQSAGDKTAKLGSDLTKLTAPLVAAGAAAVKFGAEFDASMSNLKAVMNTTDEGMEDLRQTAIDFGEKTVYSANEVSDALYYMGLAGWSANESMESIGGVLNLAAAGNLDLARTSDIVTDGMTALGLAADGYTNGIANAEHFSNVLAATMSNTNTTVDMLGEAFKYVAPVAGSLGYNIEDLSIALGLMANAGIKASQGGTTLRNILNRMAKPTKESIEAMDALGVSLDDGNGNMLSFIDVLRDLRLGLGDVTELTAFAENISELDAELEQGNITNEQYDQILNDIIGSSTSAAQAEKLRYAAMLAGQRGMSGLLAIASASDEEFEQLTETIYASDKAFDGLGYAAGMAETQMDNLKGDFTKLTSALGTTQIIISDLVKGELRELVQGLTKLVMNFNSLDKSQQKQIVKWAAIATATGPAIYAFGKVEKGVGAVVSGIGKGISAMGAFSKSMKAGEGVMASLTAAGLNPMTLAIVGVGAALAAGLYEYKRYQEAIQKTVKDAYGMTEAQKELAEQVNSSKSAYDELNKTWPTTGQGILDEYSKMQDLVGQYNALVNESGELEGANQRQADMILGQLAQALGMEIDQVKALIDENGKLGQSIDQVIEAKKREALLSAYRDEYTEALRSQREALQEYNQALLAKAEADRAVGLADQELAQAQEAYTRATTDGTEQIGMYRDALDLAKLKVEEAKATQSELNTTFDTAKATLDGYTSTIQNYEEFEQAVVTGSGNINTAQDLLINNIQRAENSTRASLEAQVEDARRNYYAALEAHKAGGNAITEQAVNDASRMLTLTQAELAKLPPAANELGRQVPAQEGAGITANAGASTSAAANLKQQTLNALQDTGGEAHSVGWNIGAGLGSGLSAVAGQVIGKARILVSGAIQAMKNEAVIQSPSHVVRKEVGAMMGLAVGKGIEDETKTVDRAAEGLIDSAIESMQKTGLDSQMRAIFGSEGIFPHSNLNGSFRALESNAGQYMNIAGGIVQSTNQRTLTAPINVNVYAEGGSADPELANRIAYAITDQIMRRNEVFR